MRAPARTRNQIEIDRLSDENGVYMRMLQRGDSYYIERTADPWTPEAGRTKTVGPMTRKEAETAIQEAQTLQDFADDEYERLGGI